MVALFLLVFPQRLLFWWTWVACGTIAILGCFCRRKLMPYAHRGNIRAYVWNEHVPKIFVVMLWLKSWIQGQILQYIQILVCYLTNSSLDWDSFWECKSFVFRRNYGTCPSDYALKRKCVLFFSLRELHYSVKSWTTFIWLFQPQEGHCMSLEGHCIALFWKIKISFWSS